MIRHLKKIIYRICIAFLKRYNAGKMKPDSMNSFIEKCIFLTKMGYIPNFKNHTDFGELVCYRKFYGDYIELAEVADKFKVRKYVKNRIGERYLTKIYDVADRVEDINENRYLRYPDKFVVKPNHASRRVFINKKRDYALFRRSIDGFLDEFGNSNNEFHYKLIKKKLLFEEYLTSKKGLNQEYKVEVFHGKAEIIAQSSSVYEGLQNDAYRYRLYDRNWEEFNIQSVDAAPLESRPDQLIEILEVSEELSKGWDYMRVDLILADGALKFGEMTPTGSAGRFFYWTREDLKYIYENYVRL